LTGKYVKTFFAFKDQIEDKINTNSFIQNIFIAISQPKQHQ